MKRQGVIVVYALLVGQGSYAQELLITVNQTHALIMGHALVQGLVTTVTVPVSIK